ncbi:sigma-54-dependent Fis family transcriptional regulator [Pseudomonas sp. LP_7_YM]|uniref:sigma-54-dependent Fis family transcriptional regulator n=1 Tax=Pseudomonas sp. LP_7_YM TaxID=2485137 RepID=UPI001060E32D|nr:sigma-54-dependent Fis family transcriptional regulator [Pseudomonas sp. LP_7_YM]TDV61826.1 transcriptional regulator of acetoin/glycerol metabolism [Pseudomonas sp. LP_7_YM]
MHSNHFTRHAQQVLTVAQGKSTHRSSPSTDPSIARSWARCVEDYHLDPAQPMAPTVLEHARVLESRERLQQVLTIAGGEMNRLLEQLSGGHAVLLTDDRGVILNCVTEPGERKIFERAGLWLGADWSESREGTNGIGTCLVERQPVTIHRDEHFRGRHTGLTCSASPVFDPHGDLLAVLDVSSARHDVSRQSQFHTMALVNLSAKMIESSYFLRHFNGQWLLRFHLQADSVGLFSEGLLTFDEEGRVRALNQSALNLLSLGRADLIGQPVESLFDCSLDELMSRATPDAVTSWPLRTCDGRGFFAVLRGPSRPVIKSVSAPVFVKHPAQPAPGVICLGDAALQADFRRALKVFERDVPLLINGETGSGKEAFAKAVHQASQRTGRPFVALNCAAIPESLIESELFGYRGGSFTGARKEGMRGKLQQADGGTLFLDEIGDMPVALQTRLLRVLEDRLVVPIGGEPQAVDVRIISATHRNLLGRVEDGSFREDLYYRLNGLEIALPALRERSDKSQLLDVLLEEEAGGQPVTMDAEARRALLHFSWPGNVRQMRNVLRTLAALCEDDVIRLDDLPTVVRQQQAAQQMDAPLRSDSPLDDAERSALIAVLDTQRWHMTHAARALGVSRNTLYRKLRKHGIAR